jgi:hypothetical protein
MVGLGRWAGMRVCVLWLGLVVLVGWVVPSVAWGAVTSISAGTGISLSTNPCTSTCTVQLATGWALSNLDSSVAAGGRRAAGLGTSA